MHEGGRELVGLEHVLGVLRAYSLILEDILRRHLSEHVVVLLLLKLGWLAELLLV